MFDIDKQIKKAYLIEEIYQMIVGNEEDALEEGALSPKLMRDSIKFIDIMISKIEERKPFTTVDGEPVYLKNDPDVIDKLRTLQYINSLTREQINSQTEEEKVKLKNDLERTKRLVFTTLDGNKISLSKLKRTDEFGGKPSDFYVKKENEALSNLSELVENAKKQSNSDSITIRVYSQTKGFFGEYKGVTGVVTTGKVKGIDPKSDFELTLKDTNRRIYISHKDGNKPSDFSQWSGVTEKQGERVYKHPEVISFIDAVKAEIGTNSEGEYIYPNGISYGRIITDRELQMMAVFGQDYKKNGEGSYNNVDLVAQGVFTLTPEESDSDEAVFILSAHHLIDRNDLDSDFPEAYMPTLVTRFIGDRKNYGVKFMRATIYPLKGRKIHKFI